MPGIGIGIACCFGNPPWSPADESPEVWLVASPTDVVLAGSDVTQWTDRTANGHDAINSAAPASYVASHAALGNHPAVMVAPGEAVYEVDGAHPAADDWTEFVVLDYPAHAAAGGSLILNDGAGGLQTWLQCNAVNNRTGYTHWPDGDFPIVDPLDGPQVLVWTFNQPGNVGNLYRNGALQGAGTYSVRYGAIVAGAAFLGASAAMYVAEFGLFHGVFDAAKLAKLHAYTLARYGV